MSWKYEGLLASSLHFTIFSIIFTMTRHHFLIKIISEINIKERVLVPGIPDAADTEALTTCSASGHPCCPQQAGWCPRSKASLSLRDAHGSVFFHRRPFSPWDLQDNPQVLNEPNYSVGPHVFLTTHITFLRRVTFFILI